jgi:hypothetical protein
MPLIGSGSSGMVYLSELANVEPGKAAMVVGRAITFGGAGLAALTRQDN